MTEKIRQKLDRLPTDSGVYIMYDAAGKIIYVGKAVVLKNRIKSYFNSTPKEPKVAAMLAVVDDLEYFITKTEFDAFALEANLIKKYKPRYNIMLKDDKSAPYVKVNVKQEFPSFEITRKVKNDGAKYYGPYFCGVSANQIMAILRAAYGVKTCKKSVGAKNARVCLNYHIKLCAGVCANMISKDDYAQVVARAMAFLAGRENTAQVLLTEKMIFAAEEEDFERAILYRDRLAMLERLNQKTVADLVSNVAIDVFAYACDGEYSVISVMQVRGGKMMGIKNHSVVDINQNPCEALSVFMAQYYQNNYDAPDQIVSEYEVDESVFKLVYSFNAKTVEGVVPQRGTKKQLLDTAKKNAEDYLIKSRTKETVQQSLTTGAAAQLAKLLGIDSCRRIECYDISNISGTDAVSSQVVFIDGSPSKRDYRKYKIKTVVGADDFASMRETLIRRLARAKSGDEAFCELPDLIVIDGGKGQLSSAEEAVREMGLNIPLISLAKRNEEIYTLKADEPIVLPKTNNALKMLMRLRDEAHRFAITYHRSLRDKKALGKLKGKKGTD